MDTLKQYLLTAFIIASTFPTYGQNKVETIVSSYCDCFQKLNFEEDIQRLEREVEKCTEKKRNKYKSELIGLLNSSENQIEFLKKFGAQCENFIKYTTKLMSNDKSLSDQEQTQIIQSVINYFSFPSEKGKLPKSVNIMPGEIGILYNKLLNKIYPDSIYKQGFHLIQPFDSLIIFDVRAKRENFEFDLLLNDKATLEIELSLIYSIKPNKVGHLYNDIGKRYFKMVIIPEFRYASKTVISKYSSTEIYQLESEALTSDILDTVRTAHNINYFDIHSLNIINIEYPHILETAAEAGLLDAYNLLNNDDIETRKKALDILFKKGNKTAYLIIMNHWNKEKDKEVADYILTKLEKRN